MGHIKPTEAMFEQSDTLFWSRIRLAAGFILTGSQEKAEVQAGESTAKLYRVGGTIRIDLKYAGGENPGNC